MKHPLQDLFDLVPAVACKGDCGRDRHQSCCGPIACSVVEARLLEEYLGTQSPWIDLGAGNVHMDPTALTLHTCPHLSWNGRCQSYAVRPLICRLWGAVQRMRCPWGCQPERWLSDDEAGWLLAEAARRSLKINR